MWLNQETQKQKSFEQLKTKKDLRPNPERDRERPMVALESMLNSSLANRASSCDFPTAESPIRTTLKT
jgi:hypothetical protein